MPTLTELCNDFERKLDALAEKYPPSEHANDTSYAKTFSALKEKVLPKLRSLEGSSKKNPFFSRFKRIRDRVVIKVAGNSSKIPNDLLSIIRKIGIDESKALMVLFQSIGIKSKKPPITGSASKELIIRYWNFLSGVQTECESSNPSIRELLRHRFVQNTLSVYTSTLIKHLSRYTMRNGYSSYTAAIDGLGGATTVETVDVEGELLVDASTDVDGTDLTDPAVAGMKDEENTEAEEDGEGLALR